MRLGVFGGTFDPVHFGHLFLAEQCRERCRLDEVWFLPAGVPPHKKEQAIAPGTARAEMLDFAIAGHEKFRVDRRELKRTGPSYTVDTLAQLHDERPDDELFFLIGADSLADLATWREPQRIAELATLVAVNRGGVPLPALDHLRQQLGDAVIARIQIVEMPGVDFSSSDIRERILTGRSIRYMTPRSVECYVGEQRLYRGEGVETHEAPPLASPSKGGKK